MAVTMTQTAPPSAADRIYTLRSVESLASQALKAEINRLARAGTSGC